MLEEFYNPLSVFAKGSFLVKEYFCIYVHILSVLCSFVFYYKISVEIVSFFDFVLHVQFCAICSGLAGLDLFVQFGEVASRGHYNSIKLVTRSFHKKRDCSPKT